MVGRAATWAVLTPPRKGVEAWARLRPSQQLVLGFASYVAIGTAMLCLACMQRVPGAFIDHLFNVTSAVSTTGLTTISVADSYTFSGQVVLVVLFQLGGIGYMTLSSLAVLARGGRLSDVRRGVLAAGFSVPRYFVMQHFLVHVVVFTLACEALGTGVLWWRFAALGVDRPLWWAVFHSVSAFSTAGFSLSNSSLEPFAGDVGVNVTVGALSYLGAIGYIVAQDVWYSLKFRERMVTLTSKVILAMTGAVFVSGTLLLLAIEPGVHGMPLGERVMACAFQVMTASSTAGFNTVPIGSLSRATLLLVVVVMMIGASPSGTGGGIKTTTVSALIGTVVSVARGRARVVVLGREVPPARVLAAVAAATFYVSLLGLGVFGLCLTERGDFLPLAFEAASALGTVGLSMGVTGELSIPGKVIVTALMFAGRCGPLTLGLAMLRPGAPGSATNGDDLAV